MYQVLFSASSKKDLEKIDNKNRIKIISKIEALIENPYSKNFDIKKLKGVDSVYRLRVGDFRVLYEILNMEVLIFVIEINHRKDVYK